MKFTETKLSGAYVIDLERIEDDRGFFARAWSESELSERGLESHIVQCNTSSNKRASTIRGFHLQKRPHQEVKMIRCVRGALHDVIIDLRQGSPTFMEWIGVDLTDEDRRMLYVPRGFAHGYQTLVDDTEAFYMVTDPYTPGAEVGIRWDDPAFKIEWPMGEPASVSEKDRAWPDFSSKVAADW